MADQKLSLTDLAELPNYTIWEPGLANIITDYIDHNPWLDPDISPTHTTYEKIRTPFSYTYQTSGSDSFYIPEHDESRLTINRYNTNTDEIEFVAEVKNSDLSSVEVKECNSIVYIMDNTDRCIILPDQNDHIQLAKLEDPEPDDSTDIAWASFMGVIEKNNQKCTISYTHDRDKIIMYREFPVESKRPYELHCELLMPATNRITRILSDMIYHNMYIFLVETVISNNTLEIYLLICDEKCHQLQFHLLSKLNYHLITGALCLTNETLYAMISYTNNTYVYMLPVYNLHTVYQHVFEGVSSDDIAVNNNYDIYMFSERLQRVMKYTAE